MQYNEDEDQKLINDWLNENEIEILKTRKPRQRTSMKINEPSSFQKKITKYSQNWRIQKNER